MAVIFSYIKSNTIYPRKKLMSNLPIENYGKIKSRERLNNAFTGIFNLEGNACHILKCNFNIKCKNIFVDNARPRPIFGVDLTEHLRHTQSRIAQVMEKCCTLLRASGFTEKGLFRVNGNNTKIRRMKAAFDTGQIDVSLIHFYIFSIKVIFLKYSKALSLEVNFMYLFSEQYI
uniref:Rho-GAP domain-containing protein n=1 Tax=Heterorhabditis bacteriophora TaxID=37862 RepID=A0A1I7WLU7_HETBA